MNSLRGYHVIVKEIIEILLFFTYVIISHIFYSGDCYLHLLFIQVHASRIMGLLYTKFYMDFDEDDWKQISNDPILFQTLKDDVTLDIEDTSHKSYKIHFKEGSKIKMLRVTGRFRITWDDEDIL